MLAYFDTPIGWKELFRRTVKETLEDDAPSLAAQLAYYFFLSLFPALLCVIALASLFPLENFTADVERMLAPVAPSEVIAIIRQQMLRISQGDHTGLLSIGLLGALWSSSAALTAVIAATNRAFDITEHRPFWRVRLTAIGLTIGLALFILVSFTLVVAGPEIAEALAARVGLGGAFVVVWKILQWPVAFALVATGIGFVYHFAPDADQDWAWFTPGSVLATLLWLLGSLGFRYYAVNFADYGAAYGTIGGIIVLMLWFYLTGFVLVAGAEMNAEMEHASPWSQASVPLDGQRKKIGRAAARVYQERLGAAHTRTPGARTPPQPSRPSAVERLASCVTLFLRWRHRSHR
jgi:membrane protein